MVTIDRLEVPTGGNIIIEADRVPIQEYADLQALIAQKEPETDIDLIIMRNGEQKHIKVTLAPRPTS